MFNIGATIVTLLGLLLVVGFAAPSIGQQSLPMPSAEHGIARIFSAAALVFFSYVGFEDVVKFAEETKKPSINTPWPLIVSGIIVMVVYVVVAISSVVLLMRQSWQNLVDHYRRA